MLNLKEWYNDLITNPNLVKQPLFIGEIGINHNGDIQLAKKLILLAKENGCDFVKFQKRNPDICVPSHKKNELKETPWGSMTYLEYKKKIEFGQSEFLEIDEYCRELGIQWSASAWDLESQDFISNFDIEFNKIASAMNTNHDFIEKIAMEGKVTFASTGMSTMSDVVKCVAIFEKHKCPLVLMHTISTYPAKEEDLNLAVIGTLRKKFNLPIGYSGHESSVIPSIVAAALGAVAIERHITLDRTMWGTDQAASIEAGGVHLLSNALRKIPIVIGGPEKKFNELEKKVAKNLRYWS
jgi:N-acetylneuraminate synthase